MNKLPGDLEGFEKEVSPEVQDFMESFRTQRCQCPPLALLRAASVGALPEELLSPLKAHVLSCRSCQILQADVDLLELENPTPPQFQQIISHNHQIKSSRLKPWFKTRNKYSVWAIAAAASLMVGAFFLFHQIYFSSVPPDQSSRSAPPKTATPSSRTSELFRLEKPPVKLGMAALVWRGDSTNKEQFLKDIAPALNAYRGDEFAHARALFVPLTQKYPESGELFFYLGISQLFLGKYSEALISFQKTQQFSSDSFSDEVLWYSALACQRMGQNEPVLLYLQRLCSRSSPLAARACAALKDIHAPGMAPVR
jgi:tetratricopeptide (TPR) repeat protein